jgi:ribosomal protein S18 acetylase RimI-like enzyme
MDQQEEINNVVARGLELALRQSDIRDIGFVYELMRNHFEEWFNKTSEGWSRKKFKEGYNPDRVIIIEHEDMPIGFFDLEIREGYAYAHNLHISGDYQRYGIGPKIMSFMEDEARNNSAYYIVGKVFSENVKFLRFLTGRLGYRIERELPEENSVFIRKDLEVTV